MAVVLLGEDEDDPAFSTTMIKEDVYSFIIAGAYQCCGGQTLRAVRAGVIGAIIHSSHSGITINMSQVVQGEAALPARRRKGGSGVSGPCRVGVCDCSFKERVSHPPPYFTIDAPTRLRCTLLLLLMLLLPLSGAEVTVGVAWARCT